MKDQLPVSVAILQSITGRFNQLDDYLSQKKSGFSTLKKLISDSEMIDQDERFLHSPELIQYFQSMMLLGMSMFGGIMVTCLTSFSDDGLQVEMTWDSGVSDRFVWGKYNDDFRTFIRYYQDRLSSKPQFRDYLPNTILIGIDGFLKSYLLILDAVEKRVNRLITSKQLFIKLFEQDINRDLLFIVISSLPQVYLSTFFVEIHQYFPEDLDVTTPSGRKMKLAAIFGNQSVDMVYLMEKIQVYLDLYFNSNLPIFKEITRTKTADYIKKLCEQSDVFEEVQQNITSLKELQLNSRIKLYRSFQEHLETVLS